jgi:hypothetical protein
VQELIRRGGGVRTEDFTIAPNNVPATTERLRSFDARARLELGRDPNFSDSAAAERFAQNIDANGIDFLEDFSNSTNAEVFERIEDLLPSTFNAAGERVGINAAQTPLPELSRILHARSRELRVAAERQIDQLGDIEAQAIEAAVRRGQEAQTVRAATPDVQKALDDAVVAASGGKRNASLQMSQVFEDAFNPKFNFDFSPEQTSYIQTAQEIVTDVGNYLRENGLDFNDVITEGKGSRYFPRMVEEIEGIVKDALGQNLGKTLGRKPTSLKPRGYLGQDIEIGVAKGVKYASDPILVLEALQSSAYRAVADKQFADTIKTLSVDTGAQIVGRGGLPQPLFKDNFFDEATTNLIQRQLGLTEKSQFQRLAETSGQIGDINRTMITGFDFGAPLLQGLPLLATDPVKWGRGLGHQFKAFAQPKFHQKYLSENIDTVDEMLRLQIPISGAASDYYDALRKGAFLEKTLSKIPLAGKPIGQAAAGFQRSFDAMGDFSRIEQFKALRATAALKGQDGMEGLATYLRNSTGAMSTGRLGINPSQQAMERGFLFFSARYTRSSLALVANAMDLSGSLQGDLARKAFRNMAIGGIATYYMTATALGQEPKLDPTKGDFMTVRIGNDNIGVGSFWTSFVRLIGSTGNIAMTDPKLFASGSTRDNPLLRWVRSRSAPVTGVAWDVATGSDFLGTPVEGPSLSLKGLGDLATTAASQTAPFWIEAMVLQQPSRSGPVAGVSEIFGARTFPLSLSARRNDVREQRAQAHFSKPWDALNRLQKERIENDPAETDLRRLTKQAQEDRVLRGRQLDKEVDKFFTETRAVKQTWLEAIEKGYKSVQMEQMVTGSTGEDLPSLREGILNTANSDKRAGFRKVQNDPDYADVREWLAEASARPGQHPEKPEDYAYDEYIREIVTDTNLQKDSGFDFDLRDQRIAQFRVTWGNEVLAYVNARFAEGRDTPKIIKEFWDGRDRFAFYWEGAKDEVIASRPDSSEVEALYKDWEDSTEIRQKELREQFPNLNATINTISRVRGKLREGNAELDAFLFRWGYTSSFRNTANQFDGSDVVARDYLPRENYILQPQEAA